MSIGLVSAKISGRAVQGTQRVTPARTSIAEDAKFIRKPVKRVKFKMVSGGNSEIKLPGQKNGSDPIPFLGQGGGVDVGGENIATGTLGKDGLTAKFNVAAYSGGSGVRVKMVVDNTPQKDFSFTPTQEEGRQTNHANSTHYSQQYDAYGRPIIGFSREPYDFAATKYIATTSQIKFQQNVATTQQHFDSLGGSVPADAVMKNGDTSNMLIAPPEADLRLLGEKVEDSAGEFKPIGPKTYLGEQTKSEGEVVSINDESNDAELRQKGESEISKALGIDFTQVLRPENATQASQAHDLKAEGDPVAVSLKA